MVMMHVWFIGLKGHFGEVAGKNNVRPLFLLFGFFCLVEILGYWGLVIWHLWIGRSRHPGPNSVPPHVGVEVLNVGGWLTHGDLSLWARVDFLAVVEHRLIPARVRSEWYRLRSKGLSSIWLRHPRILLMLIMLGSVLSVCGVVHWLFLPLLLLSSRSSLIAVGWFGVCFLLVLDGSCTWLSCTVFRVLILTLSSLR